jgi:hypothetical protein
MRGKIILPNFIAVLVLGLVSFFFLKAELGRKLGVRLDKKILVTSLLHERSDGLRGFEVLNDVRAQAMSKDVVGTFSPMDIKREEGQDQGAVDKKVRELWFKKVVHAVEVYSGLWGERTGKRPEIVLLTDRNGVVIARNITPNACPAGRNVAKTIPVVARALDGQASYAIWSVDDSSLGKKKADPEFCQLMNSGLLEVAAAPVWYDDDIAGALVVGFEISNGTAKKKAALLDFDVSILTNGEVYSTSFETDTARQSLEQQLKSPEVTAKIHASVNSGKRSDVFDILVEEKKYLALISPVVSAEKKDNVVTVILGSVESATSDLDTLVVVLVVMGLMLLLVLIAGFALASHFLKPVMAIEEGLLKIINGEYQYRFDIKSAEVGGLGYRINQLISVLTGEEEEEENEE